MKKANFLVLVLTSLVLMANAEPAQIMLPGQREDGSVLLPNQWSLRPVGRQVSLGDFPVNIAVHPDGQYAAVLHCGHGPHEIVIVDVITGTVVSRQPLVDAYYGLEFSASGNRLYCSGCSSETVRVFDFKKGKLTENVPIRLRPENERGIPCGIAVSENSRDLYVANVWGQSVSKVNLLTRSNVSSITPIPGSEKVFLHTTKTEKEELSPSDDLLSITKRDLAQLDPVGADAPFPYACRLDDRHQFLYVSLWGRAEVAVIDLETEKVVQTWPTEEHPNEMALTKSGRHLFVANANRNTVTVFDTAKGKAIETLYASFSPKAPPGSMPTSLALSPDEKTLYVANSCNNNIAVFDVSIIGKSRSLGFIPVGWFPTSVRVTPDGKSLLVANGKGLISKANPRGPVPGQHHQANTQVIDELFPGTLSIIDLKSGKAFRRQIAEFSEIAYRCTPQKTMEQATATPGNPVPEKIGKPSPIKYVIYMIKENRTYDQMLGDVKEGNGDSNLCLFNEAITPNLHRLARQFTLLDNFYVDAEVSADGHEWTMGAIATDFVEKTWPLTYRKAKKFPYPSEGHFAIATPGNGYLWNRAAEAGVSYFSFGEFVANGRTLSEPGTSRLPVLQGHFDPWFHGFDTSYRDVKRAGRFIEEYQRMEKAGTMPHLIVVRMPNDHTSGGVAGKLTPSAQVADNDRGVGMVVDTVSHSSLWGETAIFILEDDAQNGPDHIDAHRSPAYIISPYTQRRETDSTMYSTTSMLHTIELILGLQPMTQYDAWAEPMYNAFQAQPNLAPYEAVEETFNMDQKNAATGLNSRLSRTMNLVKEDAVDDRLMNEVIWRSVRGEQSIMPAPVRAAFVSVNPKKDDDDD